MAAAVQPGASLLERWLADAPVLEVRPVVAVVPEPVRPSPAVLEAALAAFEAALATGLPAEALATLTAPLREEIARAGAVPPDALRARFDVLEDLFDAVVLLPTMER
jgi:hypothetical protein